MDHKQLRALVARMEEHVALATRAAASDDDRRELTRSWGALLAHLNVEPAPEVRACPHCRREIMRAATLCGFCWTKSSEGGAHV